MFGQYTEQEYEEMFQKIKKYINLNNRATKLQVSKNTGISIEVIDKFIEDGRLELKYGTMGMQGPNQRRISEERRRELAEALQRQLYDDKKSRKADSSSQLVRDLKNRNDGDCR